MKPHRVLLLALISLLLFAVSLPSAADEGLERLKYNNPGLVVDLGVGLWAQPLPMDFNGDGNLDLVVNCPDKPYNGVYVLRERRPATRRRTRFPVFKRGAAHRQGGCKMSTLSYRQWSASCD